MRTFDGLQIFTARVVHRFFLEAGCRLNELQLNEQIKCKRFVEDIVQSYLTVHTTTLKLSYVTMIYDMI